MQNSRRGPSTITEDGKRVCVVCGYVDCITQHFHLVDDNVTCYECAKADPPAVYTGTCMRYCHDCEVFMCPKHTVECSVCHTTRCTSEPSQTIIRISPSEVTRATVVQKCIKECKSPTCANKVCSLSTDCAFDCRICKELSCISCIVRCGLCNKRVCAACRDPHECPLCHGKYCTETCLLDHDVHCAMCKKQLCRDGTNFAGLPAYDYYCAVCKPKQIKKAADARYPSVAAAAKAD